ncbi:hypothetical protein FACS1894181_15530 [Bacteroidia bacterium]|nr:hypothetical protein FACS1894181_15530 [Bacteroidia bacterium]
MLAVVLEILLMGSIFYITSDENYRLSTIAAAWVVAAYVGFMAIWMGLFGLSYLINPDVASITEFTPWEKAYYIGLLCISAIFIVVLIFVAQGGYLQDEIGKRTRHYVTSNRVDALDFSVLKFTFQRYMSTKRADSLLVNRTSRELEMFIEKASSVPAYVLHENYRLENAILSQSDRIRRNIEIMERMDEPASLNKEISRLSQNVRTAINQIDTLRV